MNTIEYKREFMLACGQPVREIPGTPSIEERKLNLALILEEVVELADAYGLRDFFDRMMVDRSQAEATMYDGMEYYHTDTLEYDPVAALDALCDIRVVCDGPILSSGLQHVFPAAMAEVAASNMSKFPTVMNDAAQASVHYKEKGIETTWGAVGSRWVVRNAETGKVLKPLSYFPPNLAQFLQADKS